MTEKEFKKMNEEIDRCGTIMTVASVLLIAVLVFGFLTFLYYEALY